MSNIPKPDLLHTMQIGMIDLLQMLIFDFGKTLKWLDMDNDIWSSVPAYHHLTPNIMSYEEVARWNGKELKEMSWYLLGVVTQYLQGGGHTQGTIFHYAIECTRALLGFHMYARYPCHADATLSQMENALHSLHTFKDLFLLGRASKRAKANANDLRTERVKKWKVDEETNAETWMPSKKWPKMNT